jgi:hypothetical protein
MSWARTSPTSWWTCSTPWISRTANLRELNELNFARFDAKLEQHLAELRAELRTEFHAGMHQVRTEIQQVRTELQHVRTELHTEIQKVRVDLLGWMFAFWVSTLIGIAGLAIALR